MILFLIVVNGVLAMAEFAVIAARKSRLKHRSQEGDRGAAAALELAKEPADFLAVVQIGITLVGVLAGVFGGATIAEIIADWLQTSPLLAPYSSGIAIGLVVVLITITTLIFGELVPKRLALSNPENLAAQLAISMRRLSRWLSPLVRILNAATDLVIRLMHVRPGTETPASEEEIRMLITQATQAGIFHAAEENLVTGVFRLGDRRVGTLITPRTEIEWLDLEDPIEDNLRKIHISSHSGFPVARRSLDEVAGVLVTKDLLRASLDGSPLKLEELLIQPVFLPENTPALTVLEIFKSNEPPLIFIIDEFGGVQGILTVRDILEAIVGEFQVQSPTSEQKIIRRDDGSWLVDGMLPFDEFMEVFQLSDMPDYNRGHFTTLGGFVMSHMGKIPNPGDHFAWMNVHFEIMDMDGLRVDKVLVEKLVVEPNSLENL